MKIILLSGGSGQRLWPLSNNVRSKQFLKLLKNDKGESESMVQRVYRQLRESGIDSEIVIATGKNQESSIRNHLGNLVDIVLEPERRDTFPAIALSTAYLYYKKNVRLDETIAIMPVDPFAEETFFEKITILSQKVHNCGVNLGLLGIKPTYASAKYGYILTNEDKVTGFVEKPSEEKAAEIIKKGAYWNGGVFVFRPKYMLEIMKRYIDFNSFEDVLDQYSDLPKTSFDYEVSEKEEKIVMVKYDGFWKDLGTWNTLTEVMDTHHVGKVISSDNSVNTHIINELDIPVTVIGANNMVVVASPDGILVTDKTKSHTLKDYVGGLTKTPRYEETSWGTSKVLEYSQNIDGTVSVTRSIYLEKGNSLKQESHSLRDEILTFLFGTGTVVINEERKKVSQGDIIRINRGQKHSIYAREDLKFIEVGIGEEIAVEDVQYYEFN